MWITGRKYSHSSSLKARPKDDDDDGYSVNNREEDGLRAFVVTATVGSAVSKRTGILITDDDTTSDSITLEVSPDEITESDGATAVTVTGTLNGKTFKDNVIVALIISDDVNGDGKVDDDDKSATRDLDYTANLSPLVIPGGSVSGTTTDHHHPDTRRHEGR